MIKKHSSQQLGIGNLHCINNVFARATKLYEYQPVLMTKKEFGRRTIFML